MSFASLSWKKQKKRRSHRVIYRMNYHMTTLLYHVIYHLTRTCTRSRRKSRRNLKRDAYSSSQVLFSPSWPNSRNKGLDQTNGDTLVHLRRIPATISKRFQRVTDLTVVENGLQFLLLWDTNAYPRQLLLETVHMML